MECSQNGAAKDAQDSALRSAIDALYEVFASYPLLADTSPCACCVTRAEEAALHRRPLRTLATRDLAGYAECALTTWGDVVTFKHFLPRIFEIVARESFGWPDIEVVFGKLGYASWREWPAREQEAIEAYLLAKWRNSLLDEESLHGAEALLCAFSQAVADVRPFLQGWLELEGVTPLLHLAQLVYDNGTRLIEGRGLGNSFWSSAQRSQQAQIRAWLSEEKVRRAVEEGFFRADSDESRSALSVALEVLEALGRE